MCRFLLYGVCLALLCCSAWSQKHPIVMVWGCEVNGFLVQTTSAAAHALKQCLPPEHEPVQIGYGELPDNTNPFLNATCQFELLKLNYDSNGLPSHQPGVIVTTPPESIGTLYPFLSRWIKRAEATGRTFGVDALFFAWDWLMTPEHALTQTSATTDLIAMIENAYAKSGNLSVLLVVDSCAGPLGTTFLAGQSEAWKQQYVPRSVVLGNDAKGEFDMMWYFNPVSYNQAFFNDSTVGLLAVNNFEGPISFLPNYEKYENKPIVYQIDSNTNITVAQLPEWLIKNGFEQAINNWLNNQHSNAFPRANISCIAASGYQTIRETDAGTDNTSTLDYSYEYSNGGDAFQPPQTNFDCKDWIVPAAKQNLIVDIHNVIDLKYPAGILHPHQALASDADLWRFFSWFFPGF